MASCGSYKNTSAKAETKTSQTKAEKKQNDKVVEETVKTTLDFFGDVTADPLKPLPNLQQPKWRSTQTKTTKIVDKGTTQTQTDKDTTVKTDDSVKEKPWRPPWYVSGLVVLVLLVAYNVFKANFSIVKRI